MRTRVLEAVLALCLFAVIPLTQNGNIHAAARDGDAAKVRALLEWAPALVRARDPFGRTPLMIVAWESGRVDIARLLLDRGANVNASDRFGDTPLTLAARRGFTSVVDLLVERGASRQGYFGNAAYSRRASSRSGRSGSAWPHRWKNSS